MRGTKMKETFQTIWFELREQFNCTPHREYEHEVLEVDPSTTRNIESHEFHFYEINYSRSVACVQPYNGKSSHNGVQHVFSFSIRGFISILWVFKKGDNSIYADTSIEKKNSFQKRLDFSRNLNVQNILWYLNQWMKLTFVVRSFYYDRSKSLSMRETYLRIWFHWNLIHHRRDGTTVRKRPYFWNEHLLPEPRKNQVSSRKCVERQRRCSQALVYSIFVFFVLHIIRDNWVCSH